MTEHDEWDDLPSGDFAKWENAGDTVVGTVTAKSIGRTLNNEPCPQLSIRTDDGRDVIVTAAQAHLSAQLRSAKPKVGDRIAIVFTGTEKRDGGKTLKKFDVQVKAGTPQPSADELL